MHLDPITTSPLKNTASVALATSLFELFPNLTFLGGGSTRLGFYYDFIFPHPHHPELLRQIEEKMRQLIRENRDVRELEMVGMSAKEFFKSKHLFHQADQVGGKELFQLVQIGPFIDLAHGTYLEDLHLLKHFQLLQLESLGEDQLRIQGVVFSEKEALKQFLKRKKEYTHLSHEYLGSISQLFLKKEEGITWLDRGIQVKEQLMDTVKKHLNHPTEVESPDEVNVSSYHLELFKELSVQSIFERRKTLVEITEVEEAGLFDLPNPTELFLTTDLKNSISLLQSIQKVLNIFGFGYRLIYSFPRKEKEQGRFLKKGLESLKWDFEVQEGEKMFSQLDFLVSDALGREWEAVSVIENTSSVTMRLRVERNLALLLELRGMNQKQGLIDFENQ